MSANGMERSSWRAFAAEAHYAVVVDRVRQCVDRDATKQLHADILHICLPADSQCPAICRRRADPRGRAPLRFLIFPLLDEGRHVRPGLMETAPLFA